MQSQTMALGHESPETGFIFVSASSLDLEASLESGQAFHWMPAGDGRGFYGCLGPDLVRVWLDGHRLGAEPGEALPRVAQYFGLEEDRESILATFPKQDEILNAAVQFCPGLRLLRQPAWECLATFLTSSLKQVAHIRQISLKIRERYGMERRLGEWRAHAYPEPGRLAGAGEAALRECGLGYRAKALHLAAQRVASGEADLEAARDLDDESLRDFLLQFYGVGEKIAHCVMLFAYGRMSSFPVDVWIERILRERYFAGTRSKDVTKGELVEFAASHFGKYGGYAQQFLFHYARKGLGRSLGL